MAEMTTEQIVEFTTQLNLVKSFVSSSEEWKTQLVSYPMSTIWQPKLKTVTVKQYAIQ